jgi:hypothetical protein
LTNREHGRNFQNTPGRFAGPSDPKMADSLNKSATQIAPV